MGLTCRIIPCLDVDAGRVVKGQQFLQLQNAGDPLQLARRYDAAGADELIFLDITASHQDRDPIIAVIEQVADCIFLPLTVGGGINNLANIASLLNAGADKVSINTAAIENPKLVSQAAEKWGSQCIIVAIDCKRVGNNQWSVFSHGGRLDRKLDAVAWAEKIADLGAGEILLTSMDRDGTKQGYDIELLKELTDRIEIPVIASGGAGVMADLASAWHAGASAVLAASIFHYQQISIIQAKQYLQQQQIPIRLPLDPGLLQSKL